MTFNPWSKNRCPATTKQVREKRKLLLDTELRWNIRRKGGNGRSPLRNKTGENQPLVKTGIVNVILTVTKQDSNHRGEHSESTGRKRTSPTTRPDRLAVRRRVGSCAPQPAVLRRTQHRSRGATVQMYRQYSSKVYQGTEELGRLKGTKATWWLSAKGGPGLEPRLEGH